MIVTLQTFPPPVMVKMIDLLWKQQPEKRHSLLPVYAPSRPKAPRLESLTTDVAVHSVDVGVQTDPVLYYKSIKTTTIVREHGCKNSQKREDVVTVLCILVFLTFV